MLPCDAELKLLWRVFSCCDPIGRGLCLAGRCCDGGGNRTGELGSPQLAPNFALVTVSLFMRLHAKCESSVKRNTYPCGCL